MLYSITSGGKYTILHDFNDGQTQYDGSEPYDGLTAVVGSAGGTTALYGTSAIGGQYGNGVVFQFTPSTGVDKTIYSFGSNANDGEFPEGGLIYANGVLYGPTTGGGNGGCNNDGLTACGTVFRVTRSGVETIVTDFANSNAEWPELKLVYNGGTLYGVTRLGGSGGSCSYGCGTVFSVPAPGGLATILASFGALGLDGPNGALILSGSSLHGVPGYNNGSGGSIYQVPIGGGSPTLYDPFGTGIYGYDPSGPLVNAGSGAFYGTAALGGAGNAGAIFSWTPGSGGIGPIYEFSGPPTDGSGPGWGVTVVGATLYGTTGAGSPYNNQGAIFSFMPQ